MKICAYSDKTFEPIFQSLSKDGYEIVLNRFSPDADLVISHRIINAYKIYRNLKIIKKNKIKIINFVLDVPPWRLDTNYSENTLSKYFRQFVYNIIHKRRYLHDRVNYFTPNQNKSKIFNLISKYVKKFLNTYTENRIMYLKNYRKFLKYSDLNLSISKFSQILLKRNLRIDTNVWHIYVNSDLLSKIPKSEIKYDAVNVSRIVPFKKQEVFVEAANRLGLNIIIIGFLQDKSFKLNCPHMYIPDHFETMKILSEGKFFVDASIFEGFGSTPVEAAFLGKISIVSNTYVHREILGDYPLYFERNNVDDLVEKMKMVLNGEFTFNKKAAEHLKQKFSLEAAKKRLITYIESLY